MNTFITFTTYAGNLNSPHFRTLHIWWRIQPVFGETSGITWNFLEKETKVYKAKYHHYFILVTIYYLCYLCGPSIFPFKWTQQITSVNLPLYEPIGIYRQYYTLSKRPISRKLGIGWINSTKFTILNTILVKIPVWWHFLLQSQDMCQTWKQYHICL